MKALVRFSTVRFRIYVLGLSAFLAVGAPAPGDEPGPPKSAREKPDSSFWLLRPVVLKSLQTNLIVDGKPVPMPEGRAWYRELLVLFGQKRPYRDHQTADGTRRVGLKMPEIPLTAR